MTRSLNELNQCEPSEFVRLIGPCYEHSPWIAERCAASRPFATLQELHGALGRVVSRASPEEQLRLIGAHPDLVGRAALAGQLTAASTGEQAAAGLGQLSAEEIAQFDQYNSAYRRKFGFPFIICARENKKDAILQAFPRRLAHSRDEEIATALNEIDRIAWFRLIDRVRPPDADGA